MSTWQQSSTTRTGGYSRSPDTHQGNIESDVIDILGDRKATLAWEQMVGNIDILPGGSNESVLTEFKGSIVRLWDDFFSDKNKIQLAADKKDELQKRLMLLEHEVEGLLKRRITFNVRDQTGGVRSLDYTGLLNEKENQIVEL